MLLQHDDSTINIVLVLLLLLLLLLFMPLGVNIPGLKTKFKVCSLAHSVLVCYYYFTHDLTLLRCKTCAIDIGSLKATYSLTYLLNN